MDENLLTSLKNKEESLWINDKILSFKDFKKEDPISGEDFILAKETMDRFIPYIKKVFPQVQDGIIESPITRLDNISKGLEDFFGKSIKGNIFLKRDDLLPIAGSIKARGGIYEVLKHAEDLATSKGLLDKTMDYSILASQDFKDFFSNYTIQVGSTGNLGLSIGSISAKVGFKVVVHMSKDAKEWKKDLLRSRGVKVIEYSSDYSKAVSMGRAESLKDPNSYFVDDENSMDLFLGYAMGGERTARIIEGMDLNISEKDPLNVYLPCGVGGGPGGIAYGLKSVLADRVNCYFAEPTNSPAMLLGLASGLYNEISVNDIGLTNETIADGLAVARPSKLVSQLMSKILSGAYTISDSDMVELLKINYRLEGIFLEPSALAGFKGPSLITGSNHLIWATGGSLVPEDIKNSLI